MKKWIFLLVMLISISGCGKNGSITSSSNDNLANSRNDSITSSSNDNLANSRNDSITSSSNDNLANSKNDSITSSSNDNLANIKDNTPPTISMIGLAENEKLSGKKSISVRASDAGSGIAEVKFFIDNNEIKTINQESNDGIYTFDYDFNLISEGVHTIYAIAKDNERYEAKTNEFNVTVEHDWAPNGDAKIKIEILEYDNKAGGGEMIGFITTFYPNIKSTEYDIKRTNHTYTYILDKPISYTFDIEENADSVKFSIEAERRVSGFFSDSYITKDYVEGEGNYFTHKIALQDLYKNSSKTETFSYSSSVSIQYSISLIEE